MHPSVIRELNQAARFYSRPDGKPFKSGGVAAELDKTIRAWSYIGMPDAVQVRPPSRLAFKNRIYFLLSL